MFRKWNRISYGKKSSSQSAIVLIQTHFMLFAAAVGPGYRGFAAQM
jgi:hypothetical protein